MTVPSCSIFERIYSFLAPRRRWLFVATLLTVAVAALVSGRLRI